MVTVKKHFATLTEFQEEASRRDRQAWGNGSHEPKNDDWAGTHTYEQAVNLSRYGWPEGRAKMFGELQNMKAIAKHGRLATWTHDVAGFLPDVPRAIVGMPDCMFNQGEDCHKVRPVLKIVANLGRHAGIESETINWHGAAILTWIDRLEACGYACEVTAVMFSRDGSGNEAEILVDLKQAGEVLDLDRMAFCLVNPAFHRRFKFGVLENIPELKTHRGGYGRSMELSEIDKRELEPTVYIYMTSDNYTDRAHALQNVSNFFVTQLEKAGITLPEGNTYD